MTEKICANVLGLILESVQNWPDQWNRMAQNKFITYISKIQQQDKHYEEQ